MLVDVVGHLLVRQVEVDAVAVEGSDVFLVAVRPSLPDHAEHWHSHCELTGVVRVVVFAPGGDSIGADVAVPAAHLARRPVQEIGDVALPVDVRAGLPCQQAIDGLVGALGSDAVIVASDRPLAADVRQHHDAVAEAQLPAAALSVPRGLGASSHSVAHLKHRRPRQKARCRSGGCGRSGGSRSSHGAPDRSIVAARPSVVAR